MKKMKLILGLLLITFAVACGQKAQTFDKVATFNAGFRFTPTGTIYTSVPTGGVADWNTLLNKPLTFAPSVHNHDLLYKAVTYVPSWAEITGKPALFSGSYADLTNKPAEIELSTAVLQIVLFEVLTQTQINALSPVRGKVIINSTSNCLQWYDGTKWRIFAMTN